MNPDTRKAALPEDLAGSRERWSRMPIVDDRGTDDIVGYDENGVPEVKSGDALSDDVNLSR